MKIRKLGYLLLIVPIMGLATNSWDRVELEERGFVITMAIDAAQPDEDSPADRIKLAMTLPGPRAVAEQEDDGVAIYAEQGQTIAQVKENICRKMSESLYFGHAKVLIFGEEILADGDLLARVLEDIAANSEINSKCIVLATGDPIEDILAAKPHGQNLVGLHISKYYEAIGGNGAGGVGKMDLEMLRDALNRDNSAIIPKISLCEDEEGLIFGGGAILADFELVRFAEDEELAGLLWFRRGGGEIRTICTNDEYISLKIVSHRGKFNFLEENGKLICIAEVKISGSIENYLTMPIDGLDEAFADSISGEILEIFGIMRDEGGIDGFALRERLRKRHHGLYTRHNAACDNDWADIYQNMEIRPVVNVKIVN